MRLAYLTSRYPAVSHTFIRREVQQLRSLGVEVRPFTVRRPENADVLGPADRAEEQLTESLLPAGAGRLLAAHGRAFARAPVAYLRTLVRALALAPGGARGLLWQLFYFAEAMLLWRSMERERLRHVHVHFANVAADVALLVTEYGNRADGGGWSWSLTMHGPTELYDVGAHRLPQKVESASLVACISDFARSQLMGLVGAEHWPKLHVVRCGIDPDELAGLAPAAPSPDGTLRILCVGRLVPVKGQVLLVRALAEGDPAWRLELIGDGPDRSALEREVQRLGLDQRVRVLGALGHDRVVERYGEADVFCLPSFAEGIPVVLMEAMAAGLPVVTTPIMGVPELVRDGESGLLVAPGRSDALVAALRRLAEDRSLRARLGERAREEVRRRYDARTNAGRWRDLLAALLGEG